MSTIKQRIDTLNVIISGSIIGTEFECNQVKGEFNEVVRCSKITPNNRKHLLQILHSTRGLDTALATFIRCRAIPLSKSPALGTYIHDFTNHSIAGVGRLSPSERIRFQDVIVKQRNLYMHKAGAFPNNETVVSNILSEMHSCLSRIASL